VSETPPADLLAEWTTRIPARSGEMLCVRPLRPDDRAREAAFINSLSEHTRFLRLMTPLRFLPQHLLEQLMDVDYDRRMAFVATIEKDGVEEFVAIARYGPTDQPQVVEIGVTVADAWQGRGVARVVLERLLEYAAARGFERACGYVLPENQRMLALARAAGFVVRFNPEQRVMHVERELHGRCAARGVEQCS
jgi:acetyltransferase